MIYFFVAVFSIRRIAGNWRVVLGNRRQWDLCTGFVIKQLSFYVLCIFVEF